MATKSKINSHEEAQLKELLARANIRTLKKDLAQLRENDSLQEREKIGRMHVPTPRPSGSYDELETAPRAQSPVKEELPNEKEYSLKDDYTLKEDIKTGQPEQSSPQSAASAAAAELQNDRSSAWQSEIPQAPNKAGAKEHAPQTHNKKWATEDEKQQIFLLESQRQALENQLKAMREEKSPYLILEKNKILTEQKNWQKKLAPLVEQIATNEAKQKAIEDKIQAANVPEEKQALEKELLPLEEQKQTIEKQRWAVETELAKLEERAKTLDKSSNISGDKEDTIKSKIVAINESLTEIYSTIAQRERAQKKEPAPKTPAESEIEDVQNILSSLDKEEMVRPRPTAPQAKDSHKTQVNVDHGVSKRPSITPPVMEEKDYLKDVPQATKERLEKSDVVEQQQRRKFIEDVEKWAEENKASNNTNE